MTRSQQGHGHGPPHTARTNAAQRRTRTRTRTHHLKLPKSHIPPLIHPPSRLIRTLDRRLDIQLDHLLFVAPIGLRGMHEDIDERALWVEGGYVQRTGLAGERGAVFDYGLGGQRGSGRRGGGRRGRSK
jgi:hypothetical protein